MSKATEKKEQELPKRAVFPQKKIYQQIPKETKITKIKHGNIENMNEPVSKDANKSVIKLLLKKQNH